MRYYFGLPFVAVACIIILVTVVAVRRFGPAARNMPVLEQRTDAIILDVVKPGSVVPITKVQLSKPGYVVIHKSSEGIAGEVIATGELLPAGESTDITIQTPAIMKLGEQYVAMLHSDEGNGQYDNPTTDPPITIQSEVIQEFFTVRNE